MQLASKLAIDDHVGQLVPTLSKADETVTELWVSYSVKNTIPKNAANIAHMMWMTWWRNWQTDWKLEVS